MKKYLLKTLLVFIPILINAQQSSFSHLYGASLEMNFFSIEPTSDRGYILAGGVYGPNGGDFIIIKTDSLGNEQWRYKNTQFDGDWSDNTAVKAKQMPDKGYIVTGIISVSLSNGQDFFIAKFDSLGNLKWQKQYDLSPGENIWDFLLNNDSSLVFVGTTQNKGFVMKTNFQGDSLWKKTFNNDSTNSTYGIKIYRWNNAYFIPRLKTNYQNINYGVLEILKFDTLGSFIWKRQYSDTIRTWSLGDFRLSDDSIILNLNTMVWGSNYYFTQFNKFDLQGNRISSQKTKASGRFFNDSVCGTLFGSGDTLGFGKSYIMLDSLRPITKFYLYNFKFRSLITVGTNKVVACGSAENGFSGYYGFLAVAVDTSIVGIKEKLNDMQLIKVFPNPAKNEINLEIDNSLLGNSKKLTLKIYDTSSKELISKAIKSHQTKINTESLYSGEYFYALTTDLKKIASGKLIINQK